MNDILIPNQTSWFKKWFDSSFYHQLYAHRDENEAACFITRLLAELQPPDYSTMLDLGCGAGRHARQLASHGHQVTGLDLAASSIAKARQGPTKGLQFYTHDMRLPFGKERFDYVFSFFTSFGYFKTEKENQAVIQNIFTALKPGGILVMDYLNVAYAEERLVPMEKKEIDGIIYHINRWSSDKHFFKKIEIEDVQTDGNFEYVEQVEKLQCGDFKHLFKSNGLTLERVFGDYELNDYHPELSPRLIMVVRK